MQRKLLNLRTRTYSIAELRKVRTMRGELPPLTDYSNDIDYGKRVTWDNMPSSADVIDSVNDVNNNSSVKKDSLDTKIKLENEKEL